MKFFSRADNQNRSNTMEIDFLIIDQSKPTKISPVEVKSGKNYTTSSLDKFSIKFKDKLGKKYIMLLLLIYYVKSSQMKEYENVYGKIKLITPYIVKSVI